MEVKQYSELAEIAKSNLLSDSESLPAQDQKGPKPSPRHHVRRWWRKGLADVVEVNKVGYTRAGGDEAGKYVKVQELADSPPSYLILVARDQDFQDGCGDYWVENYESLQGFFAEGNWVVDWRERHTHE
ncbi:hypothetical protein ABZ370_04180 [Streptomyces sp. NPDC005962]|uniref:hypothetical protein n=1 Tax=Streptomyces sp. NPDC005962 TaxID=3154466 RepID=UPI0033E9B326